MSLFRGSTHPSCPFFAFQRHYAVDVLLIHFVCSLPVLVSFFRGSTYLQCPLRRFYGTYVLHTIPSGVTVGLERDIFSSDG